MIELCTILLAGGLFIIGSMSLLWIHIHQNRPPKGRQNTRSTPQTKPIVSAKAHKARSSVNAVPNTNRQKSTWRKRVLKPKPRLGNQDRKHIPPSQDSTQPSIEDDAKQPLPESAVTNKLLKPSQSDAPDHKEKETTSSCSPPPPTLDVSWRDNGKGSVAKLNPKEEEEDENKTGKTSTIVDEVSVSLELSGASVSTTDEEDEEEVDDQVSNDDEEDSDNQNDKEIEEIIPQTLSCEPKDEEIEIDTSSQPLSLSPTSQLPPLPTAPSQDDDFPKKRRRRRRRNIAHKSRAPNSSTPTTRRTKKSISESTTNSKTDRTSQKNQSNRPTPCIRSQSSSKQSSKTNVGSPTRPPIKSKPFSYALDGSLSGSQERLSSLENGNKFLFVPWTSKDNTPHGSGKPRKKPIVPVIRVSSGNLRPYVDDTDNDSNVSGHESKTIHDSDSGSRHRTFSEASKRGVSDEELLEDDRRFNETSTRDDEEDGDSVDHEGSVMSNSVSVSRTTVTSVSELEKGDEAWNEMDCEEISHNSQQMESESIPLSSQQTAMKNSTLVSRDKRRNRRRGRRGGDERYVSGKSQSRKHKTMERDDDVTSPSPEIPQQFGQHLAHLAQNQRSSTSSLNGDSQYQNQHAPQQAMPCNAQGQPVPWTFQPPPHLNGVVPGQVPLFVPYPGVVDMNGNPAMPAFMPTPMNPLMTHAPTADLLSMSCPDLGSLMRSQSDPTGVHPPQMFFPTTAPTTPSWFPAVTPTTTTSSPMPVPDAPTPGEAYELSGSTNDRESLYAVSTPTGGLSLETGQTLGRSSSSPGAGTLPPLSNKSSATPSLLGVKPDGMLPSSQFIPYAFAPNGIPMLAQPICDPSFLASLHTAHLTMPQTFMTPQPVLQTIPNPNVTQPPQQEFRESVLRAPLYVPNSNQPTHIPNPNSDDGSGHSHSIPNPQLEQFAGAHGTAARS